jgi:hypothetical protein
MDIIKNGFSIRSLFFYHKKELNIIISLISMMFDVLLIYKYKCNIYNNQEKYWIQNFDVIVKTKHDMLYNLKRHFKATCQENYIIHNQNFNCTSKKNISFLSQLKLFVKMLSLHITCNVMTKCRFRLYNMFVMKSMLYPCNGHN